MAEIIVNSEPSLQNAIGELREAFGKHKYVRVKITTRKRSLDQNALAAVWYEQMAREDRQHDAMGHKAYCKLHFAVPILRSEDADYREFYKNAILHNLTYEQKLKAMAYLPATSLMTVDQLSKYLEAVHYDYASRGIHLQWPEERK